VGIEKRLIHRSGGSLIKKNSIYIYYILCIIPTRPIFFVIYFITWKKISLHTVQRHIFHIHLDNWSAAASYACVISMARKSFNIYILQQYTYIYIYMQTRKSSLILVCVYRYRVYYNTLCAQYYIIMCRQNVVLDIVRHRETLKRQKWKKFKNPTIYARWLFTCVRYRYIFFYYFNTYTWRILNIIFASRSSRFIVAFRVYITLYV